MKILIADDEWFIKDEISALLESKDFKFEKILFAANGEEAYRISVAEKPDIILSDVRMPKLNGIQLFSSLRKELPLSTFILMSAYSDMETLKSAIDLSVVKFIDKPIDFTQLEETLFEAVALQEQAILTHYLNDKSRLSIDEARKKLLCDILMSEKTELDRVYKKCEKIDLPLMTENPCCVLLIKALKSDGTQISNQTLKIITGLYVVSSTGDGYAIVILFGENAKNALVIAENILETWTDDGSFLHVIVGSTEVGLGGIRKSYDYALKTAVAAFYDLYESKLYTEPPLCDYEPVDLLYFNFLNNARNCSLNETAMAFKLLADKLRTTFFYPIPDLKAMLEYAVRLIYMRFQTTIKNVSEEDAVNSIRTAHAFEPIAVKISDLMQPNTLNQKTPQAYLINDICRYIDKNYGDPNLSLNALTTQFYISAAYLCVLFKNEKDITTSQYILNTRINAAKKMLENPLLRIKDISIATGFTNCNYFIRQFKKETGITPLMYKREFIKRNEEDS